MTFHKAVSSLDWTCHTKWTFGVKMTLCERWTDIMTHRIWPSILISIRKKQITLQSHFLSSEPRWTGTCNVLLDSVDSSPKMLNSVIIHSPLCFSKALFILSSGFTKKKLCTPPREMGPCAHYAHDRPHRNNVIFAACTFALVRSINLGSACYKLYLM